MGTLKATSPVERLIADTPFSELALMFSNLASGDLTMHGVTKARTIKGLLQVKNGLILLSASFLVPVADHQIDIPKDKLLNISQQIQVTLNAQYEPKK